VKQLTTCIVATVALIPLAAPASAAPGDTVCVAASGRGATHALAVREAIRTAVETTAGMLVSSASQVENYRLTRDRILTSANAYCYRYSLIDSGTSSAGECMARVEACISTKLLLRDAVQRVSQDSLHGLPAVERAVFEAQQAAGRVSDAIGVLVDYWQRNCRQFLRADFDSVACRNIDPIAGTASLTAYYTLALTPQFDACLPTIHELNKRAQQFSGRTYCALFEVEYDMSGVARDYRSLAHTYSFFTCAKNACLSTEEWMKAFPWFTESPNDPLTLYPEYVDDFRKRVFGDCGGNNTDPWIIFTNVRAGKMYYFAGRAPTFSIADVQPEYYRTLESQSLRSYSNRIVIDRISLQEAAAVRPVARLSLWILEGVDGKSVRSIKAIDRGRDVGYGATPTAQTPDRW